MIRLQCIIDTNLLLLLLVGRVSQSLVLQHKRLKAFTDKDFDLLKEHIDDRPIKIIPNIMTEVSNLLVQGVGDPARAALRAEMRDFANVNHEQYIPSRNAVAGDFFYWLGLADCALLDAAGDSDELITVDAGLFEAACGVGIHAVNFNRLRDGVTI